MKATAKTATAKMRASAKAPAESPLTAAAVTYLLRTCNADMSSYNGFVWPTSGAVTCPDWKPRAACGNGLHGLLHGVGDQSLLNWAEDAKWLVVAVDAKSVVVIDEQKVKVPGGDVVFCGSRDDAIAKLLELDPAADRSKVPTGQASASGDYGQASASGYQGQASAYRGRARAGELGILILFRWDDEAGRDRVVVGYVGENGIEAGTWYQLNGAGAIVEATTSRVYDDFAAPECAADARQLKIELTEAGATAAAV